MPPDPSHPVPAAAEPTVATLQAADELQRRASFSNTVMWVALFAVGVCCLIVMAVLNAERRDRPAPTAFPYSKQYIVEHLPPGATDIRDYPGGHWFTFQWEGRKWGTLDFTTPVEITAVDDWQLPEPYLDRLRRHQAAGGFISMEEQPWGFQIRLHRERIGAPPPTAGPLGEPAPSESP